MPAIGLERRIDDFARVQQFEIESAGQQRMPQMRLPRPHGVLVRAKAREPIVHEGLQCHERLLAGHRPAESREISGMIGEALGNEIQHLLSERVGHETGRRRNESRTLPAESPPVLAIQVPDAAFGLATLHEDARAAADVPVEVFHPQRGTRAGPGAEVLGRHDEVRIRLHPQHNPQAFADCPDVLGHAVIAGLRNRERPGSQPSQGMLEASLEFRSIVIVETHVVDTQAFCGEPPVEMAHGRQEDRDARLVAPYVRRFARRLDHENGGSAGAGSGKSRIAQRELVAQHEANVSGHASRASGSVPSNTGPASRCSASVFSTSWGGRTARTSSRPEVASRSGKGRARAAAAQ